MTKGERIMYYVLKEVSRYSLVEWLEDRDIKEEDFEKFLAAGRDAVEDESCKDEKND